MARTRSQTGPNKKARLEVKAEETKPLVRSADICDTKLEIAGTPKPPQKTSIKRTSRRSTVVAAKLPKNVAQDQSPFFKLPAELRNAIYRYVLVEPQALVISASSIPSEPALTRVSRQIRQESLPIFYSENQFTAVIKNHDYSIAGRWHSRLGPVKNALATSDQKCTYTSEFDGSSSWANLMVWMENFYRYKWYRITLVKGMDYSHDEPTFLTTKLFDIMDTLLKTRVPWPDAKKVLEDARYLLEGRNPCWALPTTE